MAVLALAALGLLSACGSSGGAGGHSSSAAGKGTSGATDLSGVTLHVGDQVNILRSTLQAAGELDNLPYKISWSQFQNGPALIAAETGGDVDLGWMAETPVIFAQAAGSPVKVIGVAKSTDPTKSSMAIVVKKNSSIKTVADLKGKRVLSSPGTVTEYLLARALQKVGLSTKDVHEVNLQQSGEAAFDHGDVDAEISGAAPLAMALATGKDRVLVSGAGLIPGTNYLVARSGALKDAKLSAALGDFVARLTRAQLWYNAHPDGAAKVAESIYRVDPAVAHTIVTMAPTAYRPIDEAIVQSYQTEADYFAGQGLLKSKVDGADVFDDRYNATVAAAAKSGAK